MVPETMGYKRWGSGEKETRTGLGRGGREKSNVMPLIPLN